MIIVPLLISYFCIFATQCEKIDDPTLRPADPFSAAGDAGVIKKTIQDDTTVDRDKVADIWFHRAYEQRIQIAEYYNSNYCRTTWRGYYTDRHCPFLSGLKDISDDSLCDLYEDSVWSPQSLLGKTMYEAINGKWEEVGALEEITCANDSEMKSRINDFYRDEYNDTPENHLATFRKDDQDYQHVMQKCWKGLCQEKKIKPEDAENEAKALRGINPDSDKENFRKKLIELLDKHCEPDVKLIFEKYRQDNDGISDAVDKAFENERVQRAYNRFVRYIENTCKFYSDELNEAVEGGGTDTDKINRIVLTRCERDLLCILKKYEEGHGKTFTERLKSDTLGEPRYRKCIQFLCGKT